MQRVDFFGLARPIQERFVASTLGSAPPLPLGIAPEPLPTVVVVWAAVSAASAVGLVVLGAVGFGSLESHYALQPKSLVIGYAFLGALAVFAALRAVQIQRSRRELPFAPGVYLFPSGIIDTRGREFEVRRLSELAGVEVRNASLTLTFEDHALFSFPIPSRERGEEIQRSLLEYRDRLNPDLAPVSARELAMLDPLLDNGFRNPFSPSDSLKPPRPRALALKWLLGVVSGAALGAGIFELRNFMAADALYRAARAAETRTAYLAYVARGGKRPEVGEILLPRSELALVVASGSLEAVERFSAQHENSKIAAEIAAALHQALSKELEAARRTGTLTALKQFQERYGKHASIAAAAAQAVKENWQGRLAAFQQSAQPKPEVLEFFRRLLAYSVEHGSRVEVRFRRRLPESVARAEALLRKSQYFGGEASLPAQYFDPKHSEPREARIADELVASLSQAFPKDLLDFQKASALPDSPEDFPSVSVPTLLVTHRTEMSGGYLMKQPRAALTGIGVLFRITLQIPKDSAGQLHKYSVWSAPDLKPGGPKTFAEIYEDMAERAFQKLAKKYLGELLPGLGG